MLRISKLSIRRAAGFSLIEIMVGLAIGMLAAIVMLQVFALSEQRQRTATSGADAQSNGVIAFYQLQSNISRAGYGLNAVSLFNCNTTWKVASGNYITNAIPLAPVTINPVGAGGAAIIPAGDLNTDTLLVIYGNSNGEPEGNTINSQATTTYAMQMASAFTVGDRVIAAPAACVANLVLDQITAVAAPNVTVDAGAVGTTLFNLGPGPTVLAYAVRGGNLTVCDYVVNDCSIAANTGDASVWAPIASNIVSLRAVYLKDTSTVMDGIPDADGHNQTAPTTNCGWARVSAVNVAMVVRSSQYDQKVVTTTAIDTPAPINAPTWAENATVPLVGATGTLGPGTQTNEPWKHYRYKVFQAVMSLRNVAWMEVPTGC